MRRSFQIVLLCVILLGLSLSASGCAGGEEVLVHGPEEDSRLIVCTALPEEIWVPMVEEFENRTGIWVQVENGSSAKLLGLVAAEGGTFCDLVLGVSGENLEACGGLFLPYESGLSSHIQPDYRVTGGLWTPFSVLPVVLIYNSQLVRDNPPAGWDALFNSAWRGRIAFADPAADGASFAALSVLRQLFPGEDSAGGEDGALRALAANLDGQQFSFSSDVIADVSNGTCYIGVAAEDASLRNMSEGGDIAVVYPQEGAGVFCDGMAIVSGCAHEENARQFIDFVLSEDVQRFLAEVCARRSVLSGQAGGGEAGDSQAEEKQAQDSQAGEKQAQDSRAGEKQAQDTRAGEEQTQDSRMGEKQVGKGRFGEGERFGDFPDISPGVLRSFGQRESLLKRWQEIWQEQEMSQEVWQEPNREIQREQEVGS